MSKSVMEQIETVSVKDLKPHPKNPRKGNVSLIADSLERNGQFQPLVVQRSNNVILAGNHTFKAALSLKWPEIKVVYVDVDDETGTRILLAANRTADMATYDTAVLTEILSGIPNPVGTGYDDDAVRGLLAGIQDRDSDMVEKVLRPATKVEFAGSDEEDWDLGSNLDRAKSRKEAQHGRQEVGANYMADSNDPISIEKLRVAENIAHYQTEFGKHIGRQWPSSNYWGVPDLDPNMLVEDLPEKLGTWGGQDATPDDGETTYLWNAGLAATKGLPWDRTITTFFTYDTKFENWFSDPAFQVAKMVHNGCKRAIVPDTSFWGEETRFNHLSAAFDAQWVGRFMQECGVRVMPRMMFCDLESIKVGVLGVPRNAPILAVCLQAMNKKEAESAHTAEGIRLFVKETAPECLLVYAGGMGKQLIEDAKLPSSLVIRHVDNYAHVRRGVVFDNQTGKALVDRAARQRLRDGDKAELAETQGDAVEATDI